MHSINILCITQHGTQHKHNGTQRTHPSISFHYHPLPSRSAYAQLRWRLRDTKKRRISPPLSRAIARCMLLRSSGTRSTRELRTPPVRRLRGMCTRKSHTRSPKARTPLRYMQTFLTPFWWGRFRPPDLLFC